MNVILSTREYQLADHMSEPMARFGLRPDNQVPTRAYRFFSSSGSNKWLAEPAGLRRQRRCIQGVLAAKHCAVPFGRA